MPVWVAERVRTLGKLTQLYKSTARELSESGDRALAEDAFREAFALAMDIVAIKREWTLAAR